MEDGQHLQHGIHIVIGAARILLRHGMGAEEGGAHIDRMVVCQRTRHAQALALVL